MKLVWLLIFILVIEAIGAAIGYVFPANEWYFALEKSVLTPPGYVFGIVWPILYLFIGVAGWRVFTTAGMMESRVRWLAQMAFNFSFNPVLFGLQDTMLATVILFITLFCAVAFTSRVRKKDMISAVLFVPYVVWLCFAAYLIVYISIFN